MTGPLEVDFTPQELQQLRQFRASVADYRDMVAAAPGNQRSPEYNQQFNQLREEAKIRLKGYFVTPVPKAITGDVSTDRSISVIVIAGVVLALLGLGINSIILEDVIINSLGCLISSGGMLLVIGGFVVLSSKNMRQRVSNMDDLSQRADLLLYQVDHYLRMYTVAASTDTSEEAMQPSAEV